MLLVLAATPVVSLGGTRPLLLGAALTAATVCFLWLERLPLRPGLGVAALLGLALAGALPLAAAADRGEPWFDYQSFAEGLGPEGPGALRLGARRLRADEWPRTGAEVVRVKAARAAYWKVRTLEEFDGVRWDRGGFDRAATTRRSTCPRWRGATRFEDAHPGLRAALRGTEVVGAGTTLDVVGRHARRRAAASRRASGGRSASCARGDSYRRASTSRARPRRSSPRCRPPATEQMDDLAVRVPAVRAGRGRRVPAACRAARSTEPARAARRSCSRRSAASARGPVAEYRAYGRRATATRRCERPSSRARGALAKRLARRRRRPTSTSLAVSAYLRARLHATPSGRRAPAPGVAPLESFLFDTKAGYCQHFSAAMALLLRMGGVPARVATGFSPGGYSKRREAWIVRDTDAHSWVEAGSTASAG